MIRCEMGMHAYRHVSIKNGPDPLGRGPSWIHDLRCKRCKHEIQELRFRYPIIRSYDWSA